MRAIEANASLHSTASKSSTDMPERSRSLRVAGTGADSTMAASSPATAKWAKRARIGNPRCSATDRSAMSMAAAPSVICDELPAVMSGAVSGSQLCAGGSAASASIVVARRMPSSAERTSPLGAPASSFTGTGRISRAKWPESVAAAARLWLARAKASMSSRVIFQRSASTWATRNCIHNRLSTASRNDGGNGPVPPRALEAKGTWLIDSTPQAMARS